MNRHLLSLTCTLFFALAATAQSLIGNWEAQIDMSGNETPGKLIITLYFDQDHSLNANCELKMEIDALKQGTPEGLLQLGYGTNLNGTWKQNGTQLSLSLNTDDLEVNCTEVMMPNLDVERANAIVEKIMPTINSLKALLRGQFQQFTSALNETFTISGLTHDTLTLDDSAGTSQTFTRADVGDYDPE